MDGRPLYHFHSVFRVSNRKTALLVVWLYLLEISSPGGMPSPCRWLYISMEYQLCEFEGDYTIAWYNVESAVNTYSVPRILYSYLGSEIFLLSVFRIGSFFTLCSCHPQLADSSDCLNLSSTIMMILESNCKVFIANISSHMIFDLGGLAFSSDWLHLVFIYNGLFLTE